MRIFLMLMIALSVSSCDESTTACDIVGCSYDSVTPLGITIRRESDSRFSDDYIDNSYKYISDCFGLWFEPDSVVVIVDHPLELNGQMYSGLHYEGRPSVLLIWADSPEYEQIIRHEFIHEYLWRSIGDQDKNHVSGMWDICLQR